jgi:hypothetical protein
MGDATGTAPQAESSQAALIDVIKELRNEPPLLFGIGAGIVLVGILAATTSIAIVVIVAVVFVAALGAWLFRETRARVAPGASTHVSAEKAEVGKRADVGGIRAPDSGGSLETNVEADRARIGEGANVGGIQIGGSSGREGD